jgi:hypothetical protein
LHGNVGQKQGTTHLNFDNERIILMALPTTEIDNEGSPPKSKRKISPTIKIWLALSIIYSPILFILADFFIFDLVIGNLGLLLFAKGCRDFISESKTWMDT